MTNQEVKVVVASDKISFTIENAFIQSYQSHSDIYDLSKLYLEIRVSKIFQKVLNMRSSMVKSPIEIFDKDDFVTLGDMLSKLLLDQKILNLNFSNTFKFVNDSPDIRCRIFLEFDKNVREMAELPWEYIRFEKHYLAAHARSSFDLVRKINLGEEYDSKSFPIPGALNIVLIIADPETVDRALPNEEKTALRDLFSGLKKANPETFNFAVVTSPTKKNLIEKIRDARAALNLKNEPYIIHFYGHARPDSVALSPGTDNAAHADWISDTHFADLFEEMRPMEKPAVFIFTACDSGKITQFAENRGVALNMLVQHKLFAVLAMQNEIVSNVAIAFMHQVYQALLKGTDLAEAVTKGRTYLGTKHDYGGNAGDKGSYSNNAFGSPVLFCSTWKNLHFLETEDLETRGWVEKICTNRQSANCLKIEKYPEAVVRCKYCGALLQSLANPANPVAPSANTERSVTSGTSQPAAISLNP